MDKPYRIPEGPWPTKAYKNTQFLNSGDARSIRVLCEFEEPKARFDRMNVHDTVVIFGSTRAMPREVAEENLQRVKRDAGVSGKITAEIQTRLDEAHRDVFMSRYYEDARELSRRITAWANSLPNNGNHFAICSGGGPGIMEAANRGAIEAGGPSIGLNISLPMEQHPNPYQTPELSFEFHYFFIRKFWFVYLASALVVFPGGFGTLDEMFEVLTLIQTNKAHKNIPILLYGNEYWNDVLNIEAMVKWGTIHPRDLDLFKRVDDVDTAFEFLREQLTKHHLPPAE